MVSSCWSNCSAPVFDCDSLLVLAAVLSIVRVFDGVNSGSVYGHGHFGTSQR